MFHGRFPTHPVCVLETSLTNELLYDQPLIFLLLVVLAIFLLATEIGFRAGIRMRTWVSESSRGQVTAIAGALLALLGLLLGFTFSMAVMRFEARKHLVIQEANAIDTASLRSQFLPEPQRSEAAQLFREYVSVQLEFHQAGTDREKLELIDQETRQLQDRLRALATMATEKDPRSVPIGLFVQALNEVIDLHETRLTTFENHVPESAILLLIAVAASAMSLTG